MSSPVSRSVFFSASTRLPRQGCEVPPENGVHRGIHDVDARVAGRKDGRPRDAAGVVRVEVDRQADLFLQRLYQDPGRGGFKRPAMSLRPSTCAPAAFRSLPMLT